MFVLEALCLYGAMEPNHGYCDNYYSMSYLSMTTPKMVEMTCCSVTLSFLFESKNIKTEVLFLLLYSYSTSAKPQVFKIIYFVVMDIFKSPASISMFYVYSYIRKINFFAHRLSPRF